MQSNGARIAVIAVAIGVVAALFLVLSGDEEEPAPEATAVSTTTEAQDPAENGDDRPEDEAKPKPEPDIPTIVVEGGEPTGGVQKLTFTAGEDIVFKVRSDTAAEVHFHGYDVIQDVAVGGEVTFDVPADIEGVFEVELEETATQIAEISVIPG